MSSRYLLFLALVLFATAQSPIKETIDNLHSGTFAFLSLDLNSQTIQYSFKTSFTAPPKISLAVQHFALKSGVQGNWSVVPSSIRQTDVSIRFSRNQEFWSKLRINFLASTRSDLILGTDSEAFIMAYNSSVTSTVQFESQIPNFSRSVMRVFLTGCQYKGDLVDIQLSGRRLEAKQLSINVEVKNDFYLLKVFYSFVIFAPNNVPYASYGGMIAQNKFSGFYYEDAHRIIYNSNYIIYGLNKITLSPGEAIQFASLIDDNFVAGLYSSRTFDELNLVYLVLGVAPANQCAGGKTTQGNTTQTYAYRSICLNQCPPGTFTHQYNDKGLACRLCSQKLNQVLINGKCLCNSLSTDKDRVCLLKRGEPYNFLNQINWGDLVGQNSTAVSNNSAFGSNTNLTTPNSVITLTQQQSVITTVTTNTNLGPNVQNSPPINSLSPVTINSNNPTTVTTTQIPSSVTTTSQPISVSINNNCQEVNQYWTGYRCACKVGFKNDTNQCVSLNLLKTQDWISREPAILTRQAQNLMENTEPNQNFNCYMKFEYFNGQGCVCLQGYTRINGICSGQLNNQNITKCKTLPNKEWVNGVCICKVGFFSSLNNDCIKNVSITCPINSYDNGLGICICKTGYYKDFQTLQCIEGNQCPLSSTSKANGTCICDFGLMMYNGSCTKCPLGSIWDNATQKCMVVCGLNAKFNESYQKCECITGFGIYRKVCDKCPNNYFIKENYCVQCPINSFLNKLTDKCECKDGFMLGTNGACLPKCINAQTYDQVSGLCKCINRLGRLVKNGKCQICPTSTYPSEDFQVCTFCKVNQVFVQGQCICKIGFAPNSVQICVPCESLQNSFLVDGFCAFCPGDKFYNNKTKKCECSIGKFQSGIRCYDSCKNDQLIDSQNFCYSCPINEIISNGQCVCKNSYSRNNSTGVCELKCTKPNEFVYQGRCASCSLNLQYRAEIKGCACADGFYLNNYGMCEKLVILPITCQKSYFFDPSSGCLPCPVGCSSCIGTNSCTTCSQTGFSVNKGKCQPTCGDGILVIGQACDDKNTINGDGCSSSCGVEILYICQGSPSICKYNGSMICGNSQLDGNETCDDGNFVAGDGCSQKCQKQPPRQISEFGNITIEGTVNTNINNVFVVLRTAKKYQFTNENEMENFMKTSFLDSISIPTVYCSQREEPDLDLYDCLSIYSSGIPNRKFSIVFSFNFNGDNGKIQVEVDPLKSSFLSRSREVRQF